MSKRVEGEGPRDAQIVFIGEAAGADEEREGRPFVGAAGKVLDWLLKQAGLHREECYITNVVKVRPKDNDFAPFYQDSKRGRPTEELEKWWKELRDELSGLPNLRVIGLVGNEALFALTQKRGITNWRGSVLQTEWGWAVPLLHPAYISRVQFMSGGGEAVVFTLSDLRRMKQIAQSGWQPKERTVHVCKSPAEVATRLKWLFDKHQPVAFDIETAGTEVRCIGFSQEETVAFIVPLTSGKWTSTQQTQIMRTVKSFLESNVPKVAHNICYDATFLKLFHHINVSNVWMDTMVAWHTLYPEVSKGLDVLTSLYTDVPYYKWMLGKNITAEQLFEYNGYDCMTTIEIAHKLDEELKKEGLWGFYEKQMKPLLPVLIDMQVSGVCVDHEKRDRAKAELEAQAAAEQAELSEIAGHPLNVNSPKQVQRFLYDELKLPKKWHRKTGNTTANEQALRELMVKTSSKALGLILSVREKKKLTSTFLGVPTSRDGRIRCSYNPCGTETGRLSSSASIDGTGGNLQNVPKGICREVIIPASGNLFISMDLQQAEARVVAYLSEDLMLINAFSNGESVHLVVGRMVFGKDFSKDSTEYRLTKGLVHGYNYGMGIRTFAASVGLSEAEAKPLFAQMDRILPSVRQWHSQVEAELSRGRTLFTPLGRRRIFLGGWSDVLIREAIAFVPQSTIGDLTNGIMTRFVEQCPFAWPVLNTHDGFVVECPSGKASEAIETLKRVGRVELFIKGRTCVVPMEIKTGSNWGDV